MSEPLTVVGLGPVTPDVVSPVLGPHVRFVPEPTEADLATAVGAIVRAAVVVDTALLERMPRLRVVARTGVGTDLVDLHAAAARGIPVVITPGSNTRAVAEGTLGHALHLVKRFGPLHRTVREGRWADRTEHEVGDLDGATIGIVGYGRIGRRVAELAVAFGMRVLAHDPVAPPPPELAVGDLGALAGQSSVLTLHVPLTPGTRHLVDADLLSVVRPGTVLVNSGRGGLVDLDAALAALHSGQLGGLGLDVFDPEPPSHHPVFDHPHVLLTPHVMGLSTRATRATFVDAARGVADVLAGRQPAAVAT